MPTRAALQTAQHVNSVAAGGADRQGSAALSAILGTAGLLALNAAALLPKLQVLGPQLVVHSLGIGLIVKSFEDLRAARQRKQRDDEQQQLTEVQPTAVAPSAQGEVTLQLEAALHEATRLAQREAQEAANASCINRALRHSNDNLARQLREERALRMQQRLRLERLHKELAMAASTSPTPLAPGTVSASPSPLLAVTCDPAVERAVLHMVKSEEMQAMEKQLVAMRHELLLTRAELEQQRARADACQAASKRLQQ